MIATTQKEQKLTLNHFLALPETKPAQEYFSGDIITKSMPQGQHSMIQTYLAETINQVTRKQKIALALTELRCTFGDRSLVPDIAVFEWHRIPRDEKGKIANRINTYPDWIIEILSPEQSANQVIKKIIFAMDEGTKLGWLIAPQDESVMIFQANQFPQIKSGEDNLTVLEVIKDWHLSVKEIFEWLNL
jgi:Uma2 family endonuclease